MTYTSENSIGRWRDLRIALSNHDVRTPSRCRPRHRPPYVSFAPPHRTGRRPSTDSLRSGWHPIDCLAGVLPSSRDASRGPPSSAGSSRTSTTARDDCPWTWATVPEVKPWRKRRPSTDPEVLARRSVALVKARAAAREALREEASSLTWKRESGIRRRRNSAWPWLVDVRTME